MHVILHLICMYICSLELVVWSKIYVPKHRTKLSFFPNFLENMISTCKLLKSMLILLVKVQKIIFMMIYGIVYDLLVSYLANDRLNTMTRGERICELEGL